MRRSAYFFALGLFVGVIATALLCRCRGRVEEKVTSDTVVVWDTIFKSNPIHVTERIVRRDTISAHDTAVVVLRDTVTDSVDVVLPITQRVYEDSLYKAYVSGYAPALDSISIYQSTKVITNTVEKKPRRWGVGVGAGAGFGAVSRKVEPMVGIGIYYRIW